MKFLSRFYIGIIFFILYAPILVVVLFSFNASGSLSEFAGFSLYWYKDLFRNGEALQALKNSLILAVTSSLLATALGTLAAFAIARTKSRRKQKLMEGISNIPMMNPDIVTGVSMMLLFVGVGAMLRLDDTLGFWTMLLAHTTFNLPYVILSVLPKFRQMDKSLTEAALDLGCTPLQSFFKVQLPAILPGVFTGMIMSFTMSLDDFVISYFTSGSTSQTLPVTIYSMTRRKISPEINALSTLIFITVVVILIVKNIIESKQAKKNASYKGVRA